MITAELRHLEPHYDVVISGGGPAGMAAALGARERGAEKILLVDREREAGGILWQCIHHGFGLHHFGEELTGPEYAQRYLKQVIDNGIDVLTDTYVYDISPVRRLKLMSGSQGIRTIDAGAVVLAMGARERTRGAIRIPGERPSGVLTAGLAQKFVNMMGLLPGRRVVILGSGDIGLIMARRLTLEGVEVLGVFEIMPYANGLNRNIVQCLHDFDIPLHLSHTIVDIRGRERVTGVTVAPVSDTFKPDMSHAWDIACDTVLLSIGLIPENELSRRIDLRLDPVTSGPVVNSTMETSANGVFACGNVVHIHDLVDFVSQESMLAGKAAGDYAMFRHLPADNIRLIPGDNVAYCVPHTISTDREHIVYMRVRKPMEECIIRFGPAFRTEVKYVFPAEMVNITLMPEFLEKFHNDTLRIDVIQR